MPTPICTGRRITSDQLYIEAIPAADAPQVHIQDVIFHADVASGTYQLRVNGELTAPVTFAAVTLDTDMQAAVEALPNVEVGDFTFTATGNTVEIEAAANGFWIIDVIDVDLAGNTTSDPNVQTEVTQQGSDVYVISGDLSSFSYEETVNTSDTTPMDQLDEEVLVTKRMMTYNVNSYKVSDAEWTRGLQAGICVVFNVYPQGKLDGREFFSFKGLVESTSPDFPDHDVVELEISGRRQGAMLVPFYSVYRSA